MSFVRSLAKLRHRTEGRPAEWLVVGLGNPGTQYARTRHNVGFMCLNRMAQKLRVRFHSSSPDRSDVATAEIAGVPVLLAEPQTYMNESGRAAERMVKRLRLAPDRIILIYDDVDLPFGTVRIRQSGSDGGHRGVKSVIQSLGTSEIARIKIGVGRGAKDTKDYVLSEFSPDERRQLPELGDRVAEIVEAIVSEGTISAMNRFNGQAATQSVTA